MKRRSLLWSTAALAGAIGAKAATAETPPSPMGKWLGTIPGFGDMTLTITTVKADGKLEGQVNFSGANYTFVFGDKVDKDAHPPVGTAVLSGNQLVIMAPRGGVYTLKVGKQHIEGTFARGPMTGTLELDRAG